jgi:hypothetical protein
MAGVVDEGEAADYQVAHPMPVEEREHVLEIMDCIHDSRLPTGGFNQFHIAVDGDQGRQAFLGCVALPELEIPRLGIFVGASAVSDDSLSTQPTSLFQGRQSNPHFFQYFSSSAKILPVQPSRPADHADKRR